MQVRQVDVDTRPTRWLEAGDAEAPPVVFVHGIPTGPRLWRHVVSELGSEVRALCWEMLGYAGSIDAGRGQDLSVARQADYLAAWMDEIGLEEAVVAGHDLGGGVAQILAVRHPERVRGLMLTNAISYDSWPVAPVKAVGAGGMLVERLPESAVRWALWGLIRGGHETRRRAEEAFRTHWSFYDEAQTPAGEALARQAAALDVSDTLAIAERLPELDLPVHLAWGTGDPFQEIGYGYRLAYDLGATLDRIEGGKHFTPEDYPERVAEAVQAVLRDVEG